MRLSLLIFALIIGVLVSAAPPKGEKANSSTEKERKSQNTNQHQQSDFANRNRTDEDEEEMDRGVVDHDYCYDSSWSFKCRQTSPTEYELECKIVNADGDPCFPDLVRMIEVASPLATIQYPIHTLDAYEAAVNIDVPITIITAENIESISLQAPFERIPADAFVGLPQLKRITLESLDGVKTINVDKNAFRNTTAKHLHLIGHDVRHILDQHVDMHYFNTITFSDVEIDCYHDFKINSTLESRSDWKPSVNVSCERLFENMKDAETLNLESIYVRGQEMDDRVFYPLRDTLKKLTMDVVFKPIDNGRKKDELDSDRMFRRNETDGRVEHRGHFPMESFSYMTKLEDMELYLYEPIIGLNVDNETTVPLVVSKTLTRLVLSCRYCKQVDMKLLGQWLPNLRHLTISAPLNPLVLTEQCMKSFSKLEELIIYDSNLKGFKTGVFNSLPVLKHFSIKYAPMVELNSEHWEGVEDTLESLTIIGTQIKSINVSRLEHLTYLDISENRLTTLERDMFPDKAKFTELNISYNPIKEIRIGFLHGVEITNHILRINGWEMESFDLNVLEGVEKVRVLDLTKNLRMKKLRMTGDFKKLPSDMKRVIVGRSPYLKLEDENGNLAKIFKERNITLVVEGKVACTCKMNWMIELEKDYPELIEIDKSRAVCSRQGTEIKDLPESFWKKPTVVEFFKSMKEKEVGACKKEDKKP